MPTVMRFGRCRITMYFDDDPPPHFHVIARDDREGKFRIDTLELWAGEIDPRDAREALEWAAENRAELLARWREYSEEDL
jgi:hypothetical protein